MLPESLVIAVFAGLAFLFAVAFAPRAAARRSLLVRGGVGLAGTVAIAAVPTFDLALLVLLALGVLNAAVTGGRPLAIRLRAPVFAVGALAIAGVLARVEGPDVLDRFAAVALVAGLAAGIGLLPYLHPLQPDEAVTASPVAWLAFVGPVLAIATTHRVQDQLNPDAGGAFGAMLIGVGFLNIAWGSFGAWLTESTVAAWRYSFIADWGLALSGLGLTVIDGRRAALLVLFSIVLGRLPLYLASRQALREKTTTERPINLIVAAALAGAAPFAGFAARILLLRAATQLYWPLALVLAVGMLLWLPGSFRLGKSLGFPRGRQALGVAIVLAVNVAVGLYPLPVLGVAGL